MEYQTVYTILEDSARVPWLHLVIGLTVLPILAAGLWRARRRGPVVGVIVCGLLWNGVTMPLSWLIYRKHQHATEWLRKGECDVVEGTIEHFHPMPYGGHAAESFTVSGVQFSYSDFDDSRPGFNRTSSHGGPLRAGLPVRLHHRDRSILKIEVLRNAS